MNSLDKTLIFTTFEEGNLFGKLGRHGCVIHKKYLLKILVNKNSLLFGTLNKSQILLCGEYFAEL